MQIFCPEKLLLFLIAFENLSHIIQEIFESIELDKLATIIVLLTENYTYVGILVVL